MDWLMDILEPIANFGSTIVDFIAYIPEYFKQFFIYLNAWYVKVKFTFLIYSIEFAYETAQYLLAEIGFNELLQSLFNRLPSELRYYAFLFKIPEAISIYINCMATAFVLRLQR